MYIFVCKWCDATRNCVSTWLRLSHLIHSPCPPHNSFLVPGHFVWIIVLGTAGTCCFVLRFPHTPVWWLLAIYHAPPTMTFPHTLSIFPQKLDTVQWNFIVATPFYCNSKNLSPSVSLSFEAPTSQSQGSKFNILFSYSTTILSAATR
jgi:hypothetical protein